MEDSRQMFFLELDLQQYSQTFVIYYRLNHSFASCCLVPVMNMLKNRNCYVAAAIYLSCHVICQGDPQQCKSEYSINGMMLKGHVSEEKKSVTILSCVLQCDANIRCQSINYVLSQYVCELNSRTKDARPEDFIPDADRIYITRLFGRGTCKIAYQCTCISGLMSQLVTRFS